ncbi:hypothetical protein NIES4071_45120 [Calothrix sp. NIES-4071]|nr:hypothetical protein NIES4071_45120 [Calothrix sp. NIES-4071]BAZ58825.1 hypothetical protein NIES4105_45050 [Calothrix sp. NIES-4105]
MIRFHVHKTLAALSLSAMLLAGCNNAEQAGTQAPPTANPASKVESNSSTGSSSNTGALLSVVSKTKAAVNKGDFAEAKKEFDGFENAWEKVEDGIKAKSRDKYNAIEKNADQIEDTLKASKPSKEKLSTALQSLEKDINAVPKS